MDLRKKFDEAGFAVIENFLTDEEVQLLKAEGGYFTEKLSDLSVRSIFSTTDSEGQQNKDKYFLESAHNISYFFEKDALDSNGELLVPSEFALNKVGHALHIQNNIFKRITCDKRVKDICFQFGFEEPVIVQSMYIYKNPNIGGEVTPHQDATYLYTDPNKLLGFWIALDDAMVNNGCLWFQNGSHTNGVHRRYLRNPKSGTNDLLVYDKPSPNYEINRFSPLPAKKGTCVLIHGHVVHYSPPNTSREARNAYAFHVIDNRNCMYAKDNWLQPDVNNPFLSL